MSMNPFRKQRVEYVEFGPESALQIERLIKAVSDAPPIGETSIGQKLDAIIAMLQAQANVAADLALVKAELSIIHGLVVDLSADPEKAKELSERIRKQVEALQSATPKIQ
jgi:hypothetical protein